MTGKLPTRQSHENHTNDNERSAGRNAGWPEWAKRKRKRQRELQGDGGKQRNAENNLEALPPARVRDICCHAGSHPSLFRLAFKAKPLNCRSAASAARDYAQKAMLL